MILLGPDAQGAYLNMVVKVDTSLDPYAFIRRCQRIEASALRKRVVHWGPRTLDVDLLFFDDVRIDSEELTVPHPRIDERQRNSLEIRDDDLDIPPFLR